MGIFADVTPEKFGSALKSAKEAALADRVLVVTDGQIRLSGTPAEVFDRVEEMREMHLDLVELHCDGQKMTIVDDSWKGSVTLDPKDFYAK